MRIGSGSDWEPPPPPPPPPAPPPAPSAGPAGAGSATPSGRGGAVNGVSAHAGSDPGSRAAKPVADGVDFSAATPSWALTALPPLADFGRPANTVKLTPDEERQLQRSGASTLLTEDADDNQVNCLDRAVDTARALPPDQRAEAQLVLLNDSRPGVEGLTGHAVVRVGDEVIDPASDKHYASTDAYLQANPQYSVAGTVSAQQALAIFDTPAGSPDRARALADASVPPALRNMLVADPGGDGDRSMAARVKAGGPDVQPNRAQSDAAGRQDGASLRAAIDNYDRTRVSWDEMDKKKAHDQLQTEMGKLKQHTDDPAYSAALMSVVGSDGMREMFERDPVGYVRPGDNQATPDPQIESMRDEFAPLANAFYTADKSGQLPDQIRQEVLSLPPPALARFLRMGPEDPAFAKQAAEKILDAPAVPYRDGAVHDLLKSYQDPHLLLELAGNEKYAKELFDPNALHYSQGYEKTLISELGAALYSSAPGAPDHQAAMGNLIKLAASNNGDSEFRKEIERSPELAKMLAEHLEPYLPGAAYAQANELAGAYKDVKIPPFGGPTLPPGVSSDDVAQFIGGLIQHKDVRDGLIAKATDLARNGQVADFLNHPENLKNGLSETGNFRGRALADLGLVSLVMQGISVSHLDHNQQKAELSNLLNNYGVGLATSATGPAGPFIQDATQPAADQIAEFMLKYHNMNDISPSDYHAQLGQKFSDLFSAALEAHNQQLPPDQRLDRDHISGIENNYKDTFDAVVLDRIEHLMDKLHG